MRRTTDEIDRRVGEGLRSDTAAAARRAGALWPSILAKRDAKSPRRKWAWAAIPAAAAAVAAAVLLVPGWLPPAPDIVVSPSPGNPAGTSSLSPGNQDRAGVTLAVSPSRYSPLMSSAFGIRITALDHEGRPAEGDWSATWGFFLPATEVSGGWKVGERQEAVQNASEVFWSFIDPDIPDNIEVVFSRGDRITVLSLERDPQYELSVRVSGPPYGPVSVGFTFSAQILPVDGSAWPAEAVIRTGADMAAYCRKAFDENTGSRGGYGGGLEFLAAFQRFLTGEDLDEAGFSPGEDGGIWAYDTSLFEVNDMMVLYREMDSSSVSRRVRSVTRRGDSLTVEIETVAGNDVTDDTVCLLFAIAVPKGAADGAEINVIHISSNSGVQNPTPSPAPAATGGSGNAFGLPGAGQAAQIMDEYGMLLPDWRERADSLRAQSGLPPMEYPDGHPDWPDRAPALSAGDLVLWGTALDTPEKEALASIGDAMAEAYGRAPDIAADGTDGYGTRTVEWEDGTIAVFSGGGLYSLETPSGKAFLLPGLSAGSPVTWFVEAYGLPRVNAEASADGDPPCTLLSWPFGNNSTGNDHLFITALDGAATRIRISLVQ